MVPVDCVYWDEMASWSKPEQYEALMRVCRRKRKEAEMVESGMWPPIDSDPESSSWQNLWIKLALVEKKIDKILEILWILGEDKSPRKSQTLDALKCPEESDVQAPEER